ncbi:MAG TPA: class I SAM-dependent methyltransferase [Micromonosporaceae bacterium]
MSDRRRSAHGYVPVRDSYDRVARRYADEIGGELAGKPLDRALLRTLLELVDDVAEATSDGAPGHDSAGRLADLGCGPGHVAAHLTALGRPTVGIDLSPAMVEVGRGRYPQVKFRVGSLLDLPAADAEFLGAVALYSVIHLAPADRPRAYAQMSRVIRPGGWLLLAFHTCHPDGTTGVNHVNEWWGEEVDLDFHVLDPTEVVSGLEAAGFVVMARTDRAPWPGAEHPSRRCYLLCRRP